MSGWEGAGRERASKKCGASCCCKVEAKMLFFLGVFWGYSVLFLNAAFHDFSVIIPRIMLPYLGWVELLLTLSVGPIQLSCGASSRASHELEGAGLGPF